MNGLGQDQRGVQILSPKQLSKLLPVKIKAYSVLTDSKATQVTVGSLTYSMCQRNFTRGQKKIQFLLFDYAQAPIMYAQAIRKWNEMSVIESDSIVFRKDSSEQMVTYRSFRKIGSHGQIIFGIHNRFFLTIASENLTMEELNEISSIIHFDKFPHQD